MEIIVKNNNFEQALKTFSKQFRDSGLVKELRLRTSFESRSQRRKRKEAEALRRLKKRQKREGAR